MKRSKKTAYSKLRAKAVKSVRKASKKLSSGRRKAARRIAKTTRQTIRQTRASTNKARRTLARRTKKTVRAVKRFTKAGKKNTSKALRGARKAIQARKKKKLDRQRIQRKALKAAERARTRRELIGDVSLVGASAVETSEDPGASRPGEPPRRRTGKGQSAIKAELFRQGKQVKSRVFVDKKIAPYMALWEFRPDNKQRPFLKPTIDRNMNILGKIIGTELRQLATAKPKRKAKVT